MERLKRIIIVIGSIFGLLIGLIKIYKQEGKSETIRSSDRYDQEVYDDCGGDCGGDSCGRDDCSDCSAELQNRSIEEREISAPREVKHKRRTFRFTKFHGGNKRDRSKKG